MSLINGNLCCSTVHMECFGQPMQQELKYPVVQLLDSGNLVVRDANDCDPTNFLWQSFDHPCDNLLPGMKLGRNFKTGIERFLTSWKSTEDPATGQFSVWNDPHGFPQLLLRKGSAVQYKAGSWNGLGFTGTSVLTTTDPICDFKFVLNVSRLWVNQSGFAHRLVWSSQKNGWVFPYHAPVEKCDTYSSCGANAHCKNNSSHECACLEGFVPKSEKSWSRSNWTVGCVRKTPLTCKNGHEFTNYAGLKLPDTSKSWFNTSMSLEECKKKCLQNCSCTAYANSDISKGSGCLLSYDDIVDMRELNAANHNLFIRMATSEPGRMKSKHKMNYNNEGGQEELESWVFDFNVIAMATVNFSSENKLGEGGFGPVYKGVLMEGQDIAVERLSKSSGQGIEEFKNEVTLIAKLQQRNLVKLLGCCIQED